MNAIKITLSGVLLIALVGGGLFFYKAHQIKVDTALTSHSLILADAVKDLRVGIENDKVIKADEGYISEKAYESLKDYASYLKSLDDTEFNLTDYYAEMQLGEDEDPIAEAMEDEGVGSLDLAVGDDLGSYDVKEKDSTTTEENDPRVYSEDGIDYIRVKDLDFSRTGSDIVAYNGIYLEIDNSMVTETYDMLIKNPDNYMVYSTHEKSPTKTEKFVDVLFESVNNGDTSIVVRVFNDGKKITNFEVR